MYEAIKKVLLWITRVPPEPHDPMGDVQALRVFRAAPAYLYYRYVIWAGRELLSLLVLCGAFFGSNAPRSILAMTITGLVLGVPFLLQLGSFFIVRLDYEMRWYKITDRSLRIREGVMNVHELTMTFANIQNIKVTQGPLQRLFGIADVCAESAGGGRFATPQQQKQHQNFNLHTGVFRGVSNADEIRDIMLQRLKKLRDTGIGDTEQAATPAPAAPPVPATSFNWGANGMAVIAALRQEAALLRQAAEACAGRR